MIPYFTDDAHWQPLIAELESWIHTPYHGMCQHKGRGADCTLFIARSCQNLGLLSQIDDIYVPNDWYLHTQDNIILESFRNHAKYLLPNLSFFEIPGVPEVMIRGDICLMALQKGSPPHHCGIYCGDNKFIHCSQHSGVHYAWYKGMMQKRTKMVIRLMEL